jgi:HSP20 family protein
MDYIKITFVDKVESVESEFRRSVDEMLQAASPRFTLSRHRWRPQIDIYETAEEIIIQAEVAGVAPEAIRLEIAPRFVKVSGTREGGARDDDARYHLAEIPCGYFERTLSLPALIHTETAAASCRDGVLEIRLAKRPLDRVQRIIIQGG